MSAPEHTPAGTAAERPAAGAPAGAAGVAIGLWVVIGAGLLYGVVQTLGDVVALFGG